MSKEIVVYDSTPAMFLNKPFSFLLSVAAIVIGIVGLIYWLKGGLTPSYSFLSIIAMVNGVVGLLVLLFWWLKIINTRLTVTNERVSLRSGIVSKNIREIFLGDIRSVEINQLFLQRLLGTGDVEVSSAASGDAEIIINGIPSAYQVKKIIDEHRRKSQT